MARLSKHKWIRNGSIIGAVIILLVVLLIPAAFRDRIEGEFFGPELSEIDYTEISFDNGIFNLAGMMIIPDGEGPFPVAVVIYGSGESKRDSKWYLTIAEHLSSNGIAVLLPDKRGSEKSEGDWKTSGFTDLADDTIGAIEFIKSQKQFDYSYIGIIGMSQGGWIAPIVASKSKDVSFVVNMSGPSTTTDEQILHEMIYGIADYTYVTIARIIAPIVAGITKRSEYIAKYILGFDPVLYWKKVGAPVFVAYGENDPNVPVEESISIFQGLKDYYDLDITIEIYPEGHGIIDTNTHRVNNNYLRDLTYFIKSAD